MTLRGVLGVFIHGVFYSGHVWGERSVFDDVSNDVTYSSFPPHEKAQSTDLFVPVMGSFSDDILNFSLSMKIRQFLGGDVEKQRNYYEIGKCEIIKKYAILCVKLFIFR